MADRPERRTALVTRELARYNTDIAALSETRLANEGQLSESGSGYTFFWSGCSSDERRESGVGFAIKNQLVRKLASSPKGINDRLMTMQLLPQKGKQATLISAYAPTMTNPEDVKDKFYEELDTLLSSVHRTDKLILIGDFNARVRCDAAAWEGVIGKNGVGKCNSNGLLLLKTCAAHDLLISNMVFRLPTRNRTSWMHPRSKHWHLIDYVVIRRRDRQDVRVTKAMCSADCWTDHRLIVSKMKLRIMLKRRPQGCKALKRINVLKLKNSCITENLAEDLENELADLRIEDDAEKDWERFRNTVHTAASKVLGPSICRWQDWFDENDAEIQALLAEKHRLRKMRDLWLSAKADEIQAYADRNDYKQFYEALNTLYGPQSSGSFPLL
uniref:Endonuclease/exonuclease/phosphatase domain-containing protein n=1 Tax=Chrysemys picta bellii TaxID=8478 RepID=A0A8C3HII6_CHRPI